MAKHGVQTKTIQPKSIHFHYYDSQPSPGDLCHYNLDSPSLYTEEREDNLSPYSSIWDVTYCTALKLSMHQEAQ